MRAILQIRAAGSACPDPKSCAVGIMCRGCDERSSQFLGCGFVVRSPANLPPKPVRADVGSQYIGMYEQHMLWFLFNLRRGEPGRCWGPVAVDRVFRFFEVPWSACVCVCGKEERATALRAWPVDGYVVLRHVHMFWHLGLHGFRVCGWGCRLGRGC